MSGEHTVRGTEMSEKKPMPKCPYCGWEMQHQFDYPMSYCDVRFYCKHCNAMSPSARGCQTSTESVEKALEEAYEKAMRRYEEPNRVLTLDEVLVTAYDDCNTEQETVMYLEYREDYEGYAIVTDLEMDGSKILFEFSGIGCGGKQNEKDYGSIWRCWRRKPTKNERKNTPWEDEGR